MKHTHIKQNGLELEVGRATSLNLGLRLALEAVLSASRLSVAWDAALKASGMYLTEAAASLTSSLSTALRATWSASGLSLTRKAIL